jgi:hypothetical protein
MRHKIVTVTFFTIFTVAASAQQFDPGLVTALDRIGGSLLGASAFDAVLTDPPEPFVAPNVRIYLSLSQAQPLEIVLINPPEPDAGSNPPDPIRAFFRMTVGGPEGLKLEYDPNSGEIIPCIEPGEDLSGIGPAPADSGNGTGNLRAGLVAAFGQVGANLLGAGQFDALIDPPDPIAPQRLRLVVSKTAHIEFVLSDPPEPIRALARLLVGGNEIEMQFDAAFGSRVPVKIEDADLSGIFGSSR